MDRAHQRCSPGCPDQARQRLILVPAVTPVPGFADSGIAAKTGPLPSALRCENAEESLSRGVDPDDQDSRRGEQAAETDEGAVHILWMNGGSAATATRSRSPRRPSRASRRSCSGRCPGCPKIAVHWPLIDFECGPRAGRRQLHRVVAQGRPRRARAVRARGRGLDPQRGDQGRGLLGGVRQRPGDRPAHDRPPSGSTGWPPRPRPSSRSAPARRTAASTPWPATRPARWACPTTSAGTGGPRPDMPIVCVPGCPVHPDNLTETLTLPALPGRRPGADDPARRGAAAALAVRRDRARGLRPRPATTSRATSPPSTARRSASSSSAAGARWSSATSPSAAGSTASAAAPTSAASASAARCPASPTSSCRSWTSRRARSCRPDGSRRLRQAPCARCATSPRKTLDEEPQVAHEGQRAQDRLPARPGDERPAHDHDRTASKTLHASDTDVVEMSWDPITRIVGSLGIYPRSTSSEGGPRVPQHLVDLPRLQHLHEGQGPARRALHHQPDLRHLRRQPRHLLGLHPEHGLRRRAAAPGRVDHQPRRGRRVHVRPQHLPGEPGRGGLLRADGQGDQPRACSRRPNNDRGAARRRPRLPHHRRHHARAQPVRGRVLPRGAAGQPLHARDVLPDGGAPRAPVDALPGRRRHDGHDPAVHRLPRPG